MPWLHVKYIFSVLLFYIIVGIDLWRRGRRRYLAAMAASSLLLIGSLALEFQHLFGSTDLLNAQSHYEFSFHSMPFGLLGLFLDQQHGLLIFSPFYLFAVAGLVLFFQNRASLGNNASILIFLALYSILTILSSSAFVTCGDKLPQWVAGYSMPARFLLPSMPICITAVIYFASHNKKASKIISILYTVSALAAVLLISQFPWLLFDSMKQGNELLFVLSSNVNDLRLFLPNLYSSPESKLDLFISVLLMIMIIAGNIVLVAGPKVRRGTVIVFIILLATYAGIVSQRFLVHRSVERPVAYAPSQFKTINGLQGADYISADFGKGDSIFFYGPSVPLLKGSYEAEFRLVMKGKPAAVPEGALLFAVDIDNRKTIYTQLLLDRKNIEGFLNREEVHVTLKFDHYRPLNFVNFSLVSNGRPFDGILEFHGLTLRRSTR